MNQNSTVTVTVTLTDGRQMVIRHRNSLMGYVNSLRRRGIDPNEVVSSVDGLPESTRVN